MCLIPRAYDRQNPRKQNATSRASNSKYKIQEHPQSIFRVPPIVRTSNMQTRCLYVVLSTHSYRGSGAAAISAIEAYRLPRWIKSTPTWLYTSGNVKMYIWDVKIQNAQAKAQPVCIVSRLQNKTYRYKQYVSIIERECIWKGLVNRLRVALTKIKLNITQKQKA